MYPTSRSLVEGGISPSSPSIRDTSEPALSSPLAAVRAMSFPGATLQEEADDYWDPELVKGSSEVPPSVPASVAMPEEKAKPPSAKKRNKVEGRNHFTVSKQVPLWEKDEAKREEVLKQWFEGQSCSRKVVEVEECLIWFIT